MRDSMGNKKEPVLEHKLFCGGNNNLASAYFHHTVYQKLCGFSRI